MNAPEIIQQYLGTARGYAADVGASNGETESTTYAIEQAGWTVLCVEPNPEFVPEARKIRKLVVECACSDYESDAVTFTVCDTGHRMQAGSGLEVQYQKIAKNTGWQLSGIERKIEVRVRKLNNLLMEHGFSRLDFLSVDVEGLEDAVLRGIDLEYWKPRLICVENWPGDNKTDAILLPLGYRHVHREGHNDWYAA